MIVSSTWIRNALSLSVCVLAALSCDALFAGDRADATTRTWTDITGKFQIDASFEGYKIGLVSLRKTDDDLISVPMNRLSSSDQRYVRYELRRKQVATTKDDSEAESEVKPEPSRNDDAEPIANTKRMAGIDWRCTVKSVQTAANNDDGTQRPVMWFRVLGDMEGFM